MIIDAKFLKTNDYVFDIGRPIFFTEDQFLKWEKFFLFVEKSELDIIVNSLYYDVKYKCQMRQRYSGSGFKFQFWFKNQYEKDAFDLYTRTIFT
jgi:hypothetical protein